MRTRAGRHGGPLFRAVKASTTNRPRSFQPARNARTSSAVLGGGDTHRLAPSTIAKVFKDNGVRPAPERPSSWRTFLKAHCGQIAGMDFFATEVWAPQGLTTY